MSRSMYFIIEGEGEDTEDARGIVEGWLEDYLGREFYEEYEISRTDVKRIFEFEPGYFENLIRGCEERAAECRKEIDEYRKEGDKWSEGNAYVRLGNMLMKSFCNDMPFWNLATDSWDLPQDQNGWAVMVTLD